MRNVDTNKQTVIHSNKYCIVYPASGQFTYADVEMPGEQFQVVWMSTICNKNSEFFVVSRFRICSQIFWSLTVVSLASEYVNQQKDRIMIIIALLNKT